MRGTGKYNLPTEASQVRSCISLDAPSATSTVVPESTSRPRAPTDRWPHERRTAAPAGWQRDPRRTQNGPESAVSLLLACPVRQRRAKMLTEQVRNMHSRSHSPRSTLVITQRTHHCACNTCTQYPHRSLWLLTRLYMHVPQRRDRELSHLKARPSFARDGLGGSHRSR